MTPRARHLVVLAVVWSCAPDVEAPAPDTAAPAEAARPTVQDGGPPGPPLPYRVEPACPGEGCMYGTWLACDSIALHDEAGDATPNGRFLPANAAFQVTSGASIVDSATVVLVDDPRRQDPYSVDAVTFQPGDTLYVLDYRGEGYFSAWYADSILEVEAFWPWNDLASDDEEYAGRVLSPGSWSFWVQTTDPTGPSAWISVDDAQLAAPNGLDRDPPTCR